MKSIEASGSRARLAFLLVFILLAAGIVTTGWLYYRNYEKQFKAGIERQLTTIADLKAGDLAQYRKERLEDGSMFFRNAPFAALVRRFLEKPDDAEAQRQLQIWLGKYQPYYDEVRLLDAQGVTRLSSAAGRPAVSAAVAKGVVDALRSGRVTIHDFYCSEQDQRIHLGVLTPIFDDQDTRRALAVVFLRIDPETYLYPFIERWPTASLTAETLLVRREGNEAVFLNELRFQTNTALNLRLPLDRVALPASQAASGREGFMEGVDYRGVPVVAALRSIPDSPWSLVARMDTAEAYGPMREQLWQVAVLIGALLFGAGTFVGLVWRQQRVRFYRERGKTTEALRVSEVRYRRLFEAAQDGILILDNETGMVTDVNPFLIELLSYSREAFLGKRIWELGFFKDIVANQANFAELQEKEYIRYDDKPLETSDGRRIEVEFVSNVYQAGDRKVTQCNIRDITQRKLAERTALRLASIVESSDDAIIGTDLDGNIQSWNAGAEKMFGYSTAEMVGHPITPLIPVELLEEEHSILEKIKRGENAPHLETVRVRKDGSRVEVSITVSAIKDSAGRVVGASKVARDITERKRVEELLGASEERFRIAAETANDLVYEWDLKQSVQWFGKIDEMLGYEAGEFPRTLAGWAAAVHPEDAERTMAAIHAHLEGRASFAVEYRVRRKDGVYRWWSARGKATRTPDGKPARWIGSVTDFTERRSAEEKLRESEEQFRTMANSMPQLAWIAKADGYIFWYNQRWYEYTGTTPEQMEGWGWQSVHDPDALPLVMQNWTGSITTGIPFEMVFPLRGADGRFHSFLTRVNPIRDSSGRVVQWFGTNTDVEPLKEAEAALRESEARYRTLVENIPQKILTKDRSCRWTSINESLARDFGIRPEEVVGKMNADLFSKELADKYTADDKRVMETGQAEELEERYVEAGRETWVHTTKTPVRDKNGGIIGLFGIFWDITERKRAEAALRQSREEFKELFDSAPIGYHELDAQGRLTRVNQTELKMLGYQAEELLGQFVWSISADPEAARQAVLSKLNGAPPAEKYERTLRRKDGSTIPVQVRDKLVKGEDGAVISIRTVFQDITERKLAEEKIRKLNADLEMRVIERTAQLEAANKELEAFSYSVSHDLRAPLRAVDGFSQVVLEDYGPQLPEGCRQNLQTIRHGAQKMGKLIDDLLMFSRLSRLPLIKQAVDTGKLVRGALEELNSQREGRRIEFRMAGLPPCQADPALLKQVWVNLLSNALKYTGKREAALVEIGCAADNGRNVYFVRDNGAGFDMKYAHKLFGVFQRLHRAEDYDGTGVGLAIAQRVIHRHGGRIWAESALDSGATFYFTLEGETKL